MKKLFTTCIIVLCIITSTLSQDKNLILVHPTEYNLELFTYLIDQKIVDIDHLKIIGVYHEKESYDYSISEDFLEKNPYPYIQLLEITNELSPDDLYKSNQLTETFTNLFNISDGIFFFGGPDLPPSIYGEQMSLLTRMTDPYRHYFETSFLFHLLGGLQNNDFIPLLETKPEYVVYGICLGMQTMNIAAGGTMIQDIPSELYHFNSVEEVLAADQNMQHRNYHTNLIVDETLYSGSFHQIKIVNPNSLTGDYTDNLEPLIYSNHHQAIEKLGKNLEVIATSMDGKIIEAIRHKKYPNVLGIQFHPEGIYLHSDEPTYRQSPENELKSGKEILKENNSYQFHLKFWSTFGQKMNK